MNSSKQSKEESYSSYSEIKCNFDYSKTSTELPIVEELDWIEKITLWFSNLPGWLKVLVSIPGIPLIICLIPIMFIGCLIAISFFAFMQTWIEELDSIKKKARDIKETKEEIKRMEEDIKKRKEKIYAKC